MKENNSKTDIKTKENKKPDIKIFVSQSAICKCALWSCV